MSESRREQIIAGIGVNKKTRRAYIERWLAAGTLDADPDVNPSKPAKEPGLIRKAASFAKAAIRHVADAGREVSEDEREKRMAVCQTCEHFDAARIACRQCGCGLNLKARWRSEDCPLGKWGRSPKIPGPETAIIIPCHNYGRFLGEAIDSALAQTLQPAEVLVVDDASDDETQAVARSFAARGVGYLRVEHRNTHATRMAGLEATQSPYVCFLDADDVLPPDYLAAGLPLFTGGVGIVYSDMQQFGTQTHRVTLDEGRWIDLERGNFAHAGSLTTRRALVLSDVPTLQIPHNGSNDWIVWKQLARCGWKFAKSSALYRYRRHGDSQSHVWRSIRDEFYYINANLAGETVTIFLPLSGRDRWWPRMADWLDRQTWPAGQVRLVICDTSQNEQFHQRLRTWAATSRIGDVRIYRQTVSRPGLADENRRDADANRAVREAMPKIYNRAVRECSTEWLIIIEDDILPPLDLIDRMMRSMDRRVCSISGAYKSRFHDAHVVWDDKNRHIKEGSGVQPVCGNGFGCVLLRTSVARRHVFHDGPPWNNYDPNFYDWLAKLQLADSGVQRPAIALIDWSLRCDHAGDTVSSA